jgi:hypothetical protein
MSRCGGDFRSITRTWVRYFWFGRFGTYFSVAGVEGWMVTAARRT